MNLNKRFSNQNFSSRVAQAGFTLVELLIGLVLSLVIIGIALTYLVSASASFKVNVNDGYIQENSRFALSYITDVFRRAGSNTELDLAFSSPLLYTASTCTDTTGSAGECTDSNVGPNNSDRIAIPYILSDGISCNGQDISTFYTPDNGEIILDEIWIEADDEGVNTLYCRTSLVDVSGTLTQQGQDAPIISGIDMMKFNYAVDVNGDFAVDRYLDIDQVTTGGFEQNIRAIRVGLLVNSGITSARETNTEIEEKRTYSIFGTDSAELEDQVLRQIFSTTIHLPNARER